MLAAAQNRGVPQRKVCTFLPKNYKHKPYRFFVPNDVNVTYKDYIRSVHGGTAWGGTGDEEDILDRTFLKLREVSLTYSIPKQILVKAGPVKSASISLVGQNVLFWAKDFRYSDPDGGSENFADPSSRYIAANIKLSF